jgi:hypothetical protein
MYVQATDLVLNSAASSDGMDEPRTSERALMSLIDHPLPHDFLFGKEEVVVFTVSTLHCIRKAVR